MTRRSLDHFLGRAYAAQHGLSKEGPGDVEMAFVNALSQDPLLGDELRNRLEVLDDDICGKDYISRISRVFLEKMRVLL